jgi:hypothetical protein
VILAWPARWGSAQRASVGSTEASASLPARFGVVGPKRAKEDYEYTRSGTANVFLLICPLLGWRHLEATPHRGYREFTALMKALVDASFPEVEVIRVVLDNLKLTSTGRRTRRSRRRGRGGSRDGWSSMTRRRTTVG